MNESPGDDPAAVLRQHIGDSGNDLLRTEVAGGRGGPRKLRTVYDRKPGITG